ncbi:MAG: methylthioribulose 1-phosphate dehydratase [Spirochaetales bacterium]|nr:methylthioribulose 1-phosphate dehydratase [Spirochaetales bacterium]
MSRAKEDISELCAQFYHQGWVSGTGGGISIREGNRIYMAPSAVEKEKIKADEIFTLDLQGNIVDRPQNPALKLSECAPLFMAAYELRDAGAVLHSHSLPVMLATRLARTEQSIAVLEWTELEMIKGIADFGYYDTYQLPVIENTARECDLTAQLREAIISFPRSPAVAVRNHGIYVWGPTVSRAKTQAECIDYLCQAKLLMRQYSLETPAYV